MRGIDRFLLETKRLSRSLKEIKLQNSWVRYVKHMLMISEDMNFHGKIQVHIFLRLFVSKLDTMALEFSRNHLHLFEAEKLKNEMKA